MTTLKDILIDLVKETLNTKPETDEQIEESVDSTLDIIKCRLIGE